MGQLPERNHYRCRGSWCAGLGVVLRFATVCLESCQQLVIALLVKLTGELANHRHRDSLNHLPRGHVNSAVNLRTSGVGGMLPGGTAAQIVRALADEIGCLSALICQDPVRGGAQLAGGVLQTPHPLPPEDVLIGQQRLDPARLIRLQIAESVPALGQKAHGVVVDRSLTAVQELADGIDHILLRVQQIVGVGGELVQIPLGVAPHRLPDQRQWCIQYSQEGGNVDEGVLLLFQRPILILEPCPHVVGQLQRIIRKLTSGEELPGEAT